jgi:hypothetical protein
LPKPMSHGFSPTVSILCESRSGERLSQLMAVFAEGRKP